ncbi:MAG TPA: dihydropteroate synthase [Longimicrobiales bacterium]|nr:dihydropteroate synthase [Longimicrobiales bacterium]
MPAAPAASLMWRTARGPLHLDRPIVIGILNITPDSFWDGGRHAAVEAAVRHAAALLEAGADMIDIGGESTRPGAAPVAAGAELERVMPVLEALARAQPDALLSVDTVKGSVARAALDAGAAVLNDVSGLRLDSTVGAAAAAHGAGLILMHSRGGVDRMARYELADYGADVVADVMRELDEAVARAHAVGVHDDTIILDPGLGFSKRTEHSLALLAQLDRLTAAGYPLLVGPSRKRFIGEAAGALPAEQRLEGTIAACVIALLHGARLFRVHDVAPVRRALDFARAALP